MRGIAITRAWAMPSHDTLTIKPIRELFYRYAFGVTVDPFARNCKLCAITNDLNPNTEAQFHLLADEFLRQIKGPMNVVLFDPPYTLGQVKECYQGVGKEFFQYESQNSVRWTTERNIIAQKQKPGDIVISLGYSTTCMGRKRGYEIVEILIVSHGPAHNDILVTVERKI